MTLNEYQQGALTTATYPRERAIIYPSLGLTGEAGEVANKIKKIIRGDKGDIVKDEQGMIVLSSDTKREIAKEIGDVLWYCATLSNDLGYSLDDIANMNLDKIASRKKRGVIKGDGDNR